MPLIKVPLAHGGNGGFRRDGARLLVVVLTDEDDCSEKARPPLVSVGDTGAVADCTQREMELTPGAAYKRLFTEALKKSDGSVRRVNVAASARLGGKEAERPLSTHCGRSDGMGCSVLAGAAFNEPV